MCVCVFVVACFFGRTQCITITSLMQATMSLVWTSSWALSSSSPCLVLRWTAATDMVLFTFTAEASHSYATLKDILQLPDPRSQLRLLRQAAAELEEPHNAVATQEGTLYSALSLTLTGSEEHAATFRGAVSLFMVSGNCISLHTVHVLQLLLVLLTSCTHKHTEPACTSL